MLTVLLLFHREIGPLLYYDVIGANITTNCKPQLAWHSLFCPQNKTAWALEKFAPSPCIERRNGPRSQPGQDANASPSVGLWKHSSKFALASAFAYSTLGLDVLLPR